MLTAEQVKQFERDGYLIVPAVLTAEQVARARRVLTERFAVPPAQRGGGDKEHVIFDLLNRCPELRWMLFNPATLEVLGGLLGPDFVVLKESSAHHAFFSSWHKDTSAQEQAGHTFHWTDDYRMVEAAFYLQDNSPQAGGGLDVVPGSHRPPDVYSRPGFLRAAWNHLLARWRHSGFVSLPIKAGDLVIFDFRVYHRATRKKRGAADPAQDKLAVFFACSRNNAHAAAYQNYIGGRPDYVYLKGYSYDPELVNQAEASGVTLG